jgi:hypothetical protein
MPQPPEASPKERIGEDLAVLSADRAVGGDSTWVSGTVNGHRFEAKIYGRHASNHDWEIGRSRISKLEVRRLEDDRCVFSWNRGSEPLEKDPLEKESRTRLIVEFLTTGALDKFGRSVTQDRRELSKGTNSELAQQRLEIRYER